MKFLAFISFLFCFYIVDSQSIGFSSGIGVAQYYGDLNTSSQSKTIFIESSNLKNYRLSYSLGLNYSFKNYISLHLNWHHLYLAGYDADNVSNQLYDAEFYRLVRNLNFYTAVNQFSFSTLIEPFKKEDKMDEGLSFLSPYIGVGLGIFSFNPKTMYNGTEVELQPIGTEGQGLSGYKSKYNLTGLSIPISLGIKYYFPNRTINLALDFTYNFTNTDYIDDVSGNYADEQVFKQVYTSVYANQVTNLANRNLYGINNPKYGYITSKGEQRGNARDNDNFITTQLKLELNLFKLFPKRTCPAYN